MRQASAAEGGRDKQPAVDLSQDKAFGREPPARSSPSKEIDPRSERLPSKPSPAAGSRKTSLSVSPRKDRSDRSSTEGAESSWGVVPDTAFPVPLLLQREGLQVSRHLIHTDELESRPLFPSID